MDINELKLEDKKIVDHPYIGKYVIIRSAPSGVHFGILKSYNQQTNHIIIKDSRRIHYWEKAFTLSAIANHGLIQGTQTRISELLDEIAVGYVCEIIPCTEIAIQSLISYPTYAI